jgi:hypothetical protein
MQPPIKHAKAAPADEAGAVPWILFSIFGLNATGIIQRAHWLSRSGGPVNFIRGTLLTVPIVCWADHAL